MCINPTPAESILPTAAWRRLHRAALVFAAVAFIVASVSPTMSADLKWNDAPVVGYARVAPLDRLQRDLSFLGENVDGGKSIGGVKDAITELSAGIDSSRPAGLVVYADQTLNIVIFVPLKDEEKLLAALRARFGWEFRRSDDGLYRGGNVNVAARVSGSWLFVTGATHEARLKTLPEDPTRLFEGLDPTVTGQAAVLLDRLPAELRKTFDAMILESFAPTKSGDAATPSNIQWVGPLVKQWLSEAQRWEIELQCLRPVEQLHVTSRLVPMKESKLERWIEAAAQRPSMYEHLASEKAAAAIISSLALDAATIEPLLSAWEQQSAKARKAAPSPDAPHAEVRTLGRLVAQSLEAVTKTLRTGELDGGVVIERQGKEHLHVLAGGTLYDSRAIEKTAIEAAEMLQPQPGFRALNWAVSQNGDVSLHQLQLSMPDDNARRIFGDSMYTVVGFGPDKLYAAVGDQEAIAKLSLAIYRSKEDRPSRGEPLRITLRMAPFMALLNEFSDKKSDSNEQVRIMAEQIAPYKKNDTLEFTTRAAEGALENRLRIDMGVVRMFAAAIPASPKTPAIDVAAPVSPPSSSAGHGNLTLRLTRGETFPLEFYTETKMTTKIGDGERIDRGRYSLLYQFRVLDVAKDGSMQIETWLARATIDKESPEGKTTFDSARPPKPEEADAEMLLHGLMVNRKLTLTVRPDGTIAKVTGIESAIESALDDELKPPANEREKARAFVAQGLNEPGLRDALTRGFEFYPTAAVRVGDRWTRTTENYTSINFLLDSRFQLRSLTAEEATLGVKSQVREKDKTGAAEQPIQWDIAGSQSGFILVDPRNGRLRSGEYDLHLQGEATLKIGGKPEVRPIVADFKMIVGEPERVAAKRNATKP
ncbi:MAG: hypothetical protein K8U03_08680 [Planctomycetia bacterium]|nr:hypothetical protein [Planctomycetia bacterium]